MIGLSKRLQTICDMVRPGTRICDVGCDHAYVDIRLLQENKISFALAMDVADGPLSTARSNLELTELYGGGRCELRKSDGLAAYEPGEADCMICAGMGGILMESLLETEAEKAASFDELLLSPQSEIHLVREWLWRSGFVIAEERFLEDEGKYYTVMRAVPEGKLQSRYWTGDKTRGHVPDGVQGTGCVFDVEGGEPEGYGRTIHPNGTDFRPDWDRIAGNIQSLPENTIRQVGVDGETICKMLRSPAFQSLTEKTYGPCIVKLYLEGVCSDEAGTKETAKAEEESVRCFEQFLTETIRSRLAIAENLTQKLEDLEVKRRQGIVQRLQDIRTQIGVLQTLLAARMLCAATQTTKETL